MNDACVSFQKNLQELPALILLMTYSSWNSNALVRFRKS